MNKINNFTSTGSKLLYHPEVIQRIQKGLPTPVSLQVAPTSRCNLNCVFCSNANRKKHEDLTVSSIIDVACQLKELGLKTVEITGGGDPTQYAEIKPLINCFATMGLQIGMITNGVQVREKIGQRHLDTLSWLRISMNCIDYIKSTIDIPNINGTLGFSYVINQKTTLETLSRLDQHVKRFHPAYVRMVSDCNSTDAQQEENNKKYSIIVRELGAPYFYQPKVFGKPEKCRWGYFKPFILHDGWVYPCSSVVLNDASNKTFHERYRWVQMDKLYKMYTQNITNNYFDSSNCNHCVFKDQNDMVNEIINSSAMRNFI